MKPQLAYDAIALEYGGSTVFLRPSLRAATRLERLHGGFPELLRRIEEFDTVTIRQVIAAAAGSEAAAPLFAYAATQPLKVYMQACIGSVYALVVALHMIGSNDEPASQDTKPVAWADLYADLFKMATGRLGWTPETAWNATPSEILEALEGHADWMVLLHGSAADDQSGPTDEQRKQNADLGLDPEFDRAGLQALKSLSAMREGMALQCRSRLISAAAAALFPTVSAAPARSNAPVPGTSATTPNALVRPCAATTVHGAQPVLPS